MRYRQQLFFDATAAADRICETGQAEASQFSAIVAAVRCESGRRRFWAARLLAGLARDFAEARAAIRSLAGAAEWHVRRRALRCLNADTPRPFAVEILRERMLDQHPWVRYAAACGAGGLLLTELVEDLERFCRDSPSGYSLVGDYWLPLLRDGHVVDIRSVDPQILWVIRGGQLANRCVAREELVRRGVAAIVAEVRGISQP